jgi:hypothetical protein
LPNRRKNYLNRVFGKLTVIEETNKTYKKFYFWKLRCECGNIVERHSGNLSTMAKYNTESSCGCSRPHDIDLKNKKYGNLIGIEKLEKDRNRGYLWKFLCSCGNECVKNGAQVSRLQGALHCGCVEKRGGNNKNNLTNRVFGKLTVLNMSPNKSASTSLWTCICECGTILDISGFSLSRGSKTHCGCSTKVGAENHSFKGYEEIYKSYWTSLQKSSKIRGFQFEITIEFAWELFLKQKRLCALSGEEITLGKPGIKTASLDRIDSSLGYIENNVQWVHKKLNAMKMDINNDEFIELCGKVWKNRIGASV